MNLGEEEMFRPVKYQVLQGSPQGSRTLQPEGTCGLLAWASWL